MSGYAISLVSHAAVAFVLFYQASFYHWPAPEPRVAPRSGAVKLFLAPAATPEKELPKSRSKGSHEVKLPLVRPAPQGKKLDIASVEITIEDDVTREMITVLKRYQGHIVAVDPGSRSVRAAFSVSDGRRVTGVDIAGGLPVLLGQPEWWPDIAAWTEHERQALLICALFPPAFVDTLSMAIQKKAAELGVAVARRVDLLFSAEQPSGVIVRWLE